MNSDLLYFPYINIPNDAWTTRGILYWDNVGVIVPDIYKNNPDKLEVNMLSLVRAELVKQIFPERYLHQIPHFDEFFIQLTAHPKFNLAQRQIDFRYGEVGRLHIQKFGDHLLSELQRLEIAEKLSREWYLVESRTAKLFMMYLATLISEIENFTPATDNIRNIDFSIEQNGLNHTQINRGRFLDDLMPYPLAPDLNALRKFKDKYHPELKAFRIKLEQIIIEVTAIRNKEQRENMYQLKLAEIAGHRDKVFARLSESRIGKIVFGSLFGLAGGGVGYVTGHTAFGLFGLGNAIYAALQGYGRGDVLSSDFAYLALIDKHFRRTDPLTP